MIVVSVANKGKADVTAFVVSLQPVPELSDIVLHRLNPLTHRPSTVHHETEVHLCNHIKSSDVGPWYHTLLLEKGFYYDFTPALFGYGGGLHIGTVALNFMVSTFQFQFQ